MMMVMSLLMLLLMVMNDGEDDAGYDADGAECDDGDDGDG